MPTRRECANAIRTLSIDAIEQARSGHPGAPLGMADMAEALWRHGFKHNPADPMWVDRDRFVLSNGHASMLLYAVLHLTGYDLPLKEVKNFRQLGSATPGHPERGQTPGIEMSTGPLGQGIASAVGLALAEALLASRFNKPGHIIVDHHTYAFCGDGCLMEGVSHEACSLAGTWGLGKLIVLYDANSISIDGNIEPWFSEDVGKRFQAYHWQVIGPIDGHDFHALDEALQSAREERAKPSLIICKTHIGYASPKEDQAASHGAPLGAEAITQTKASLGCKDEPFAVPENVYLAWDSRKEGKAAQDAWQSAFSAYQKVYPELAEEFARRMRGDLPKNWPEIARKILKAATAGQKATATRVLSRIVLETLVKDLPEMIGGSADLSSSVGTQVACSVPFDPASCTGNYIFYGVREFAMGAIMNGLAAHGGFFPYGGTFLAFSDQAKNAIRLAAMMGLREVWLFSHDSIGVGEDGPTHQPIEQLASLRLTPNLNVWRPCDGTETAIAWQSAVEAHKPSCLVLSRQNLPQLEHPASQIADIRKGAYVIKDCPGEPELIFIATGSEVDLALKAAEILVLRNHRVRVVSMPCAEVFAEQDAAWRESVLPGHIGLRVAIEAGAPDYWYKYAGSKGLVLGIKSFGLSAPGVRLYDYFGLTAEKIADKALDLLSNAQAGQ